VSTDGPTQARIRELHSHKKTILEMASELGITPDRVRRVHAALNLMPWSGRRKAHDTGAHIKETRDQINRRVAIRRAAVSGFWHNDLTASAAEVAHALGYPIGDVRSDRIALGLSIRRGPDSILRLASEGLAVSEISRRTGMGGGAIRKHLDEICDPDNN
jgi:hypothetical protein